MLKLFLIVKVSFALRRIPAGFATGREMILEKIRMKLILPAFGMGAGQRLLESHISSHVLLYLSTVLERSFQITINLVL